MNLTTLTADESRGEVSAAVGLPNSVSFFAQAAYSGTAYSMDEDGRLVRLPSSLEMNVRVAYRLLLTVPRPIVGEIFARVDNLTDEVVLRQLGLPAAGREFKFGLSVLLRGLLEPYGSRMGELAQADG